jgi:hypothetical protein
MMKAHWGIPLGMGLGLTTLSLSGCDYYKQQTGYLVTRAEYVTQHYEGVFCHEAEYGSDPCDLHEVRYTFVHQDVKTIASCQAWDKFNKCGIMEVGKAYSCKAADYKDGRGTPSIDCANNGVLAIESSEEK